MKSNINPLFLLQEIDASTLNRAYIKTYNEYRRNGMSQNDALAELRSRIMQKHSSMRQSAPQSQAALSSWIKRSNAHTDALNKINKKIGNIPSTFTQQTQNVGGMGLGKKAAIAGLAVGGAYLLKKGWDARKRRQEDLQQQSGATVGSVLL